MESQSLGRSRTTPATRNHIIYTDHKGRKIPYADKTTSQPALNAVNQDTHTQPDDTNKYNSNLRIGIYGWRKKCLYLLVMALMFMMLVNLALTLWVLKVMDFNTEGMGQLRIVPGGLQLLGQALVLDSLLTSSIKSRRGQPIALEASRNFTIVTRDAHGRTQNKLFLGHDRLECSAERFIVKDARGELILAATRDQLTIGAETLTISGPGGAAFRTSVQAPAVRAPPGKQLMLESPTRSLELRAAHSINLESRAGDISASCLTDFWLRSIAGSIRIDASSIFLPKLKSALPLATTSQAGAGSSAHTHDTHHQNIHQLCVCANGKLFLAPSHGACAARPDSLICR